MSGCQMKRPKNMGIRKETPYEVTNFVEAVRVNMGIGKETLFEATYEASYEATYTTYEVTDLEEIAIIDWTLK